MYVSVFLHICLYTACVLSAEGGQKKVPGTGVLAGPQQPCKNRLGTEPRSGPSQEQQVLLMSEPVSNLEKIN